MEFHVLLDFIRTRMRMAHIYQPVMIRTLLDHRGEADDEQIAKDLLSHDRSQIEYYQQITRNMVGRVLRRHDVVEKEGKKYRLVGVNPLGGRGAGSFIRVPGDLRWLRDCVLRSCSRA